MQPIHNIVVYSTGEYDASVMNSHDWGNRMLYDIVKDLEDVAEAWSTELSSGKFTRALRLSKKSH